MVERRCLYCVHWAMLGDDSNPKAAEYAKRELHLDKGQLVDEVARKAA